MIKMMVTVVIVFTICWLPFNVLVVSDLQCRWPLAISNHPAFLQLLLSDERVLNWQPLPYFWFACHWCAMSHSCYNPIIYCYMNARFRGGFIQVVYAIPGIRNCWCVRRMVRARDTNGMATNFALTGEQNDNFPGTNGGSGGGGGLMRKTRIRIRCPKQFLLISMSCWSTTLIRCVEFRDLGLDSSPFCASFVK